MPKLAQSFCQHPGCRAIAEHGALCDLHRQSRKQESFEIFRTERNRRSKNRKGSAERGYNARWQNARRAFLAAHPLCRECEKQGLFIPATVVDHVTPHRGDYDLFWNDDNWQPLCAQCHNRKTFRESVTRAR